MKIPTIAAIRKAASYWTGERVGLITQPSISQGSGPKRAADYLKQTLRDWRKDSPKGTTAITLDLYELERDSEGFWIGGQFLETAHLQYNWKVKNWELTSLTRTWNAIV